MPLTRLIEGHAQHWGSELECSRPMLWNGQWCRVDEVAAQLRADHPESIRALQVTGRNGETKAFWAFTEAVRLKKYGRKRLVIVHEQADLSDTPRFLLTDALHWESGRVIQTGSYRWPTEIFHEFCKPVTGLEAAQVRKEEAVKRHFRLRGVAPSLLQRAACQGGKSERFTLAASQPTIGQKLYALTREALQQLVQWVQGLFAQGQSCERVVELLMLA